MKTQEVESIIGRHAEDQGGLIAILEEIQSRFGYLPEEALRRVAEKTGHPLVDVYGVATFYRWFSLKPRGRHLVSCCQGTACHVRGAPRVVSEFSRQLGVAPGETTADREFTLETVNCLGACALGPVVVSDGHYFVNVGHSQAPEILAKTREGLDKVDVREDQRVFPVEVSCPRCNHSLMDRRYLVDGTPAIRVTVSFNNHHGWLLLSSLYGSFNIEMEYEIPVDMVADFFCPHCHAELRGGGVCEACKAPMVPMIVRGGGILQVCSRRGCRAHMLDLTGENL
jgi:NADH-quinone oxidoreductase subunit E